MKHPYIGCFILDSFVNNKVLLPQNFFFMCYSKFWHDRMITRHIYCLSVTVLVKSWLLWPIMTTNFCYFLKKELLFVNPYLSVVQYYGYLHKYNCESLTFILILMIKMYINLVPLIDHIFGLVRWWSPNNPFPHVYMSLGKMIDILGALFAKPTSFLHYLLDFC